MKKECKNCLNLDKRERHHPFHKSQGGDGTYCQNLCEKCHDKIEEVTVKIANQFISGGGTAQCSSGIVNIGSVDVNDRCIYYSAQKLTQNNSNVNYVIEENLADSRIFNNNGSPITHEQVTLSSGTAINITGSPYKNTPIFVINAHW